MDPWKNPELLRLCKAWAVKDGCLADELLGVTKMLSAVISNDFSRDGQVAYSQFFGRYREHSFAKAVKAHATLGPAVSAFAQRQVQEAAAATRMDKVQTLTSLILFKADGVAAEDVKGFADIKAEVKTACEELLVHIEHQRSALEETSDAQASSNIPVKPQYR